MIKQLYLVLIHCIKMYLMYINILLHKEKYSEMHWIIYK